MDGGQHPRIFPVYSLLFREIFDVRTTLLSEYLLDTAEISEAQLDRWPHCIV